MAIMRGRSCGGDHAGAIMREGSATDAEPKPPNANRGRHRCRPPVAGLRSAWPSRKNARAFWFRRHAPPAPRTAAGFAVRSPGSGAMILRSSAIPTSAASSSQGRSPVSRLGHSLPGSVSPVPKDQRALFRLPAANALLIAGISKDAWNACLVSFRPPPLSRSCSIGSGDLHPADIANGFLAAPVRSLGISS